VRVAYADTDKAQVVHHAAYFRFLEAARVELWRAAGLDYRLFEEETGLGLPVVEARLRYRVSARFDDLIEVETWVTKASRASVWYDAVVRREPREPGAARVLLLESSIRLACVSLAEGAIRRVPDAVFDASFEPGWSV